MMVAAIVISSEPSRACRIPPCSSPTTLSIEVVRNAVLIAASPFLSTTHSSQTSGTIARAKEIQTSAVTRRSTAARRPSTKRDHRGIATRKTRIVASSHWVMLQPARRAGSPATASAMAATRTGAQLGSRGLEICIAGVLMRPAFAGGGR